MQKVFIVLFVFAGALLQAQNRPTHQPYAMIELFTSQACASCPPAHEKIENILADSSFSNDSVFLLSFHVDYWDNLGWKDPFSKASYTGRQQEYQAKLGGESVYTPMLVVNGKSGFSGNNDVRLKRELNSLRHARVLESTALVIESLKKEGDKLIFTYSCKPEARNMSIQAALVSKSDTTLVESGENEGLQLVSKNTVRAFVKLPLRVEGSRAYLKIPEGIELGNLNVVFWVQSGQDGGVMDIQVFPLVDF